MTALDVQTAANAFIATGLTALAVTLLLAMLIALVPAWLRARREERRAEERARMLETEFPDVTWSHRRAG